MSLYPSLNYQKTKSRYSTEDEIPVILFYYYKGKKIKISTGVSARIVDWNTNLENPVKRSDVNSKFKNLLLKQKMVEVEKIIQNIAYLDEQTRLIDNTTSIEEMRIELLKEYRQSLISEVVTGKLKVIK